MRNVTQIKSPSLFMKGFAEWTEKIAAFRMKLFCLSTSIRDDDNHGGSLLWEGIVKMQTNNAYGALLRTRASSSP